MQSLNTVPSSGTFGNVAKAVNTNFLLVHEAISEIENDVTKNKGLYATDDALRAAHPSPTVGDWAVIGDSIPGIIYRCTTTGVWSNTGQTGGGGTVNLSDYYTKSETDNGITEVRQQVYDLFRDGAIEFAISDESGNDVAQFSLGHIKTKKFDSRLLAAESSNDFAISDEEGNDIVIFNNGHIKTKNFDSSNIGTDSLFNQIYSTPINTISREYNALAEAGRIGYIWISDLHFNTNQNNTNALFRQLQAVCEIANSNQIDFVVIGGDLFDDSTDFDFLSDIFSKVDSIMSKCSKPVLFLSGNHDDNSYTHDVSYTSKGKYARNLMVDNTKAENVVWCSDPVDTYYYFDIPKKNLRVICLDFIDYPSGSYGLNYWGFSQSQVIWFCQALSSAGSRDVIVLSHGQLVSKTYEFWNLGDHGGYTTDIKNAIIAFNSHGSISLYGTTYNFASTAGNVKVVHSGHFHGDMDLSIGSIPNIVTSCAKNEAYIEHMVAVSGKVDTYIIPDQAAATELHANGYGYEIRIPQVRTFETINEALFDVVSINSNAVNVLRFGAGEDRILTI